VQQKAVKAAGLRAVREALGKEWHEVESFVDSETFPLVLKPVESVGSDGVMLCHSKQEAKDHFKSLMEGQRKAGAQGAGVLCQEFLAGTEYVVDHVSKNGVHKTVMVYVYDKRPTNGAAFVYWNMIPVDSSTKEAQQLIKYTRGVLDALKLDNGPTHGEVIMTKDGPCLVEMNCRTHGWDAAWAPLCRALTGGYCQLDAGIDSHVSQAAFDKIPEVMPSPFKASGQTIMLVNYFSGVVKAMPGHEKMRKLSSFESLTTRVKVGSKVELTIDLFTAVGVLVLINSNKVQLEKDIAEVRKMEKEGLFQFENQIDPSQYECSPDMVDMSAPPELARRRSRSLLMQSPSPRPAPKAYGVAAAAFLAGLAVGAFIGGKRK
jgi:biotin carboxylase